MDFYLLLNWHSLFFQFESELEMQQLRNVVKDSGAQIQQLKNCVNELESKLVRSVGSENVIYLIGGFNGKSWLSALHSFAPLTDILMPLKSMGSVRAYASAAALDGNLFVFGGGDGSSWFDTGAKDLSLPHQISRDSRLKLF